MSELEAQIKRIAKKGGASLVGIASRLRLYDAPPSGNPDYLLPSTQSTISFTVSLDNKNVLDFISKRNRLPHCNERKRIAKQLYIIGEQLVCFLRSEGFEAIAVDINNTYRPEVGAHDVTEMTEFVPDFAHRYGALVAGIGRLGWSGNILTRDYGALVELGTVLTSAKLESDPLLEKNPCDQCKLCSTVCPVEMISKNEATTISIAGITEVIAEKKPNTCCWIGCSGYHGLAPNKKWSNWSPYRLELPLPQNKAEIDKLNVKLQKADPQMELEENSFTNYKKVVFNPDWFFNTVCGFCRSVCWGERENRKHNQQMIINSGIASLNDDGEYIIADEETIELDTPYIVRVTMLEQVYKRILIGEKPIIDIKGRTPLDTAVLSSIFKHK